MTELERYNKIKKRVERARKDADKAEGALNQIMKQLKDDFDCDTIEQAESLYKKRIRKTKRDKQKIETAIAELEEKYGDD